jgi:hypothetical protein
MLCPILQTVIVRITPAVSWRQPDVAREHHRGSCTCNAVDWQWRVSGVEMGLIEMVLFVRINVMLF